MVKSIGCSRSVQIGGTNTIQIPLFCKFSYLRPEYILSAQCFLGQEVLNHFCTLNERHNDFSGIFYVRGIVNPMVCTLCTMPSQRKTIPYHCAYKIMEQLSLSKQISVSILQSLIACIDLAVDRQEQHVFGIIKR